MAERVDGPEHSENDENGASIGNLDGSSARASTADGNLDASDVTHWPFVEGADPLSDDAIERRRPTGTPMTPQLVIFGILIVFFAYFFISDVVHGSWGKAALGALVLAVCGFAIVREVRGKR